LGWQLPPLINLYESQLYNWRSKQQNQLSSSEREQEMSAEIARLKRQLAERDEELADSQRRDILREAPEMKYVFIEKHQAEFSIKAVMPVYFRLPVVAGTSGISVVIR
jgi:putative transposase